MPEANDRTIYITAAMAQAEREAISKRTIEAVADAMACGTKLGNPMGSKAFEETTGTGAGRSHYINATAEACTSDVAPSIEPINAERHTSFRAIAGELSARCIITTPIRKVGGSVR